jgi:hypothetical protein
MAYAPIGSSKYPSGVKEDVAQARPFAVVERPGAADDDEATVPASCIASTMLRELSAHTVVGARPLRVPMAETTASAPVRASTIVAGSVTSATTMSRPGQSGASRAGSRTTARILVAGGEALFDHLQTRPSCRSRRAEIDLSVRSRHGNQTASAL